VSNLRAGCRRVGHGRRRILWLVPALAAALISGFSGRADAQSGRGIHVPFDSLLRVFVSDGLVDYDGFQRSPDFARYLSTLATTNPSSLGRDDRLAFWINAYNAYTIAQINAHGERKSIRNINRRLGGLGPSGAWSELMATVGGRKYTLDQIEHEQIRPVFREPRVHFALVCAALGCPPLRAEAYAGSTLDAQLNDQGHRFLSESPTKNRVDRDARTVWLSPIFRWYGEDFGARTIDLLRAVAQFVPSEADRAALTSGTLRVRWTEYDWTLNLRSR